MESKGKEGEKGNNSKEKKEGEDMENQEQQTKARVIKVDSVESWDFYVNQASNQGCPIVVHFTASWCMPSVAMNPVFEELASAYPDALFLTVDVDEVKLLSNEVRKLFKPSDSHSIQPFN